MNEAIFTVGPDDLAAANRLHFKKLFSAKRWMFVFLGSAIAVTLLLYGLGSDFDVKAVLYILAAAWGLVVAICVLGWFLIPRQAKRTWSQAKRLWIETHVHWDDAGIHFNNARGDFQVPWSDYYRWAADERSVILYQDERTFFVLPMQQFPAGAREQITGYLKNAGVRTR